jgi:hypothetical protein
MRLREQAVIFEIGHDVAQTGGRELELAALRKRARADRLTAVDVLKDDLAQHLTGAGIEIELVQFVSLGH